MSGVTGRGRDLAGRIDIAPWHAEDLRVGDWMNLGTVQVHHDEVLAFAARFDPLPIHLDETNPVFGGVIASGVHTMALFSSLASREFIPRLALVAGKGIDRLRLPVPVRPGASLTGAVEIVDIAEHSARADVTYRSTLTDESEQVVLSFVGIAVVSRRRHRPA
ncbi:MaoC/PaaZ C-terminal domain-containing protein [Mycolicibacterium septicum]|uniref:MaoC/PaaZ C-terminal domain-containing protein n=1 Tax=Mycolicibacterium septicum TaxID=98668 RepID=UPI0023E0F1D8|nr:MaoC/PaaZ C-terminal domain-containing protein [Mycolicibacterium septicum]MDF3339467.1 MaoC/PaaZ C-terminal domain-containing protein [Mycolicibacterium septicum]